MVNLWLIVLFIFSGCSEENDASEPNIVTQLARCEDSTNSQMDCGAQNIPSQNQKSPSEGKDKKKDEGISTSLGDLPSLDSVSLEGRFNRDKAQAEVVDPGYKNKMFKLQRIPFYRAIWLDIRVNNWANFDRFEAGLDEADPVNLFSSIFKPTPKDTVPYISIHQVLSKAGDANLALGEVFRIIGHTATPNLEFPQFPTAAITIIGEDKAALEPPEEYDLVFELEGPSDESAMEQACEHVHKSELAHSFPDPIYEDICTYYRNENQAVTHTLMGANFKSEALFQKKSVAIWKPVPKKGYQCLGDLATNGKLTQPYLSIDSVGSVAKNVNMYSKILQEGLDYASYCVKEIYLSPGKLGKPIAYSPGQKVVMWSIIPQDKDGYDGSNLFVTFNLKNKSLADQISGMKFWVLNKKFLYILEDLSAGKRSNTKK